MVSVSRLRGARRTSGRWCSPSRSSSPAGIRRCRSARSFPPPAASAEARSSGSGTQPQHFALHQRDRLAPIALAGEYPVAELEVDLAFVRCPCSTSQSMMVSLGFRDASCPFRKPELHQHAVLAYRCTPLPARSPPATTSTIGRPNFLANSQSRVSCAGTAMIAPVP